MAIKSSIKVYKQTIMTMQKARLPLAYSLILIGNLQVFGVFLFAT